jgi:hypothetical protein
MTRVEGISRPAPSNPLTLPERALSYRLDNLRVSDLEGHLAVTLLYAEAGVLVGDVQSTLESHLLEGGGRRADCQGGQDLPSVS